MKLNLTKPLIVFDLETTGLDMIKDRIIQISYIKVMPDGTEDRKNLYVNPCKEIPAEVVALTGISNEDVKDAPTFKQLAATLEKEFTGCDFAGYNSNHFDVPMLAEEFLRAGIDFDFNKCRLIDAQTKAVLSTYRISSIAWSSARSWLPTSSIAAERWRKISKLIVQIRIQRLLTACSWASSTSMLQACRMNLSACSTTTWMNLPISLSRRIM